MRGNQIRGGIAALVSLFAVAACGGSAASSSTQAAPIAEPIRSLTILPSSARACPGEMISARYDATTASGRRVTLTGANLQLLERSGSGVSARADGSWATDANPLVTAMTGFRLHAALKSDSMIRADTVVAPTYGCDTRSLTVMNGFVRLGVFRSPFHDSIVVAAFERGGGISDVMVLAPSEMKSGAIRIDAAGRNGSAGRRGSNGMNGQACEAGQPGEDGEDGSPGSNGGQVDMIVEADADWLSKLVSVSNAGGRGGAGGAGGVGGQGGRSTSSSSGTGRGSACSTSAGRPGRAGRPGANGIPGPPPKVSTIPFPLLWTGSPLWSNPDYRTALEQLIELTQR